MARVNEERVITEKQFQSEINVAIANTEDEIFSDALGDPTADNSGDKTLESMGEGLEGEHLDEEDVREDVDTEVDDGADDAEDEDGGDDGDDGEDADDADERRRDTRDREDRDGRQDRARARAREDDERTDRRRAARERGEDDRERGSERDDDRSGDRDERSSRTFADGRRGIPPWRLRREAETRRASERESEGLRRDLAIANARIGDLTNRMNALPAAARQQQQQQDPEPDMFADPQGWQAWNQRRQETLADQRAAAAVDRYRQQEMGRQNERVESSFQRAAHAPGLRGVEFQAAYATLTALDPQDPRNRELVQSIYHSSNPGAALLDWFAEEGYAAEFRRDLRDGLDDRGRARGRRDRDYDRERDGTFARGREREDRGYEREDRGYDRGDDRDYRGRGGRGEPRHEIRRRFIPSLNGAGGSGSRRANADPDTFDNSDEAVMGYAMR